jgi:DNA-directed RNA polymerase specialized sigma subunit
MASSVKRMGRPAPTREQLELVESVSVPLRDLARSVARAGVATDADDLHQLAMEHALRLAPEYDPERGASFLTFAFWRVREVLREALKVEKRDRAYAAATERGARVVQDALELGDMLEESQDARRERLTMARHALAAAVIVARRGGKAGGPGVREGAISAEGGARLIGRMLQAG